MKNRLLRRPGLRWTRWLLLLLCLTLGTAAAAFPSALSATGSRVSVMQTVLQNDLPVLEIKASPAAGTLQDFVRDTLSRLAADPSFGAWKEAEPVYYPLGPGTHSWLVNVMQDKQRIGYLIISATDTGGYMLSEYGAGTSGLPYSLTDLRQYLVQEGIIHSSYSGKVTLTALYAPLLPLWKISLDGKTVYLNAAVPEVLPWNAGKAERILQGAPAGIHHTVTSSGPAFSPVPAYRSGGTDDPGADLLWLTSPQLAAVSLDNPANLLPPLSSLAFQAAGQNDTVGGPFMITGYQLWQPDPGKGQIQGSPAVYAASGPDGRRFLPFQMLIEKGSLHQLPDTH
ncbi:hypothetical protein GCM10010912_14080 [Paenibacillus albidus]|uniref:Uncharacterized protein n=1 Tax=Paenibacillus albidus TaxID=2041023 RepID=A0A917FF98_9BACL|nr:hypothetical protein [Paenibacillus albidus]GGF70029.1 hypothetical protein GCM10010912_14080 [Paenibacillus albidus]